MNNLELYFLLTKLLAPDESGDYSGIIKDFSREDLSWEHFTYLADHHLVLQAIYPNAKSADLLQYFPDALTEHLKIIHDLNAERNANAIEQCRSLTSVLNKAGISPMFMKGAANILDGLYTSPGERILHDIDILVPATDFEASVSVLMSDGYTSNYTFDPEIHGKAKHYPILYKPGKDVYLEVHRMPVSIKYTRVFSTEMVFEQKQPLKSLPGSYSMSLEHRIMHNFIHSQLEHSGQYYGKVFLRNLYDLHLFARSADPETALISLGKYRRQSAGYLDVYYRAFGIEAPERNLPIPYFHFYSRRYHLYLRYPFISNFSTLFLRLYRSFILKPLNAVFHKGRRRILIRKILDPAWYKKQRKYYGRYFKSSRKPGKS